MSKPRLAAPLRWLLSAFAVLCIVMGVIGIFVPGLPTTVFILMAAWASLRSSPRLHAWLRRHPRFGPALTRWEDGGRVSRHAKWAASATMAASALLLAATVRPLGCALATMAIMGSVLGWLWMRPE